jgi:uncharacterized membrane protein
MWLLLGIIGVIAVLWVAKMVLDRIGDFFIHLAEDIAEQNVYHHNSPPSSQTEPVQQKIRALKGEKTDAYTKRIREEIEELTS